jgi:hypothetical protein
MKVRVEKKGQNKVKGQSSHTRLTVVQCWLTQGQELDEKKAAHSRTEWPTGALVGAGLVWQDSGT